MILTHCPFTPTPDSDDWDPRASGEPSYKGQAKYFGDMVTYMDKVIGKLLATLDEIGRRDNTLVIFIGDNGTDKPVVSKMTDGRRVVGAKGRMTDAGTRVPLIASWPAGGGKGKVCKDLVDSSDILPTVCQCAGVDVPDELAIDGRSFLAQIRGEKGDPRKWTYCWYSRSGKAASAKVYARTQRYKLYSSGKMYDIPADPEEKSPLADNALSDEAGTVRAMLQGVLDKYANARPAELIKGGAKKAKR
jgi:arylsulfatase A